MPRLRGYIATSATTEVAVNGTAYTEQTSGAKRSIKSSSASDTAAGTGARTVLLTYYTLASNAVAGPYTETLTLNGATAVATVASNIALVESLVVMTAGSGGKNAGTVTLFDDSAGAGSAICSIAIGDRQTWLGHHYVPNGKTCQLESFGFVSQAAVGILPVFTFRTLNYGVANAAEQAVGGMAWYIQGSVGYGELVPDEPIFVVGPARIQFYVTPADASAQSQFIDVDYLDM